MTSRRLSLACALAGLLLLAVAPMLVSRLAGPARAAEPTSAVIFAYRHFGDDADPFGTIAIEPFEAHLSELRSGAYTVLPVPDIVAALRDNKPLPERTVGITIDDASASVYTIAWPRLRAAGLPFTLFVSPDTIESGGGARMSWAQLRELASAGVTIGNQTAGYARLLGQDRAYAIGQVQRAQEALRAQLGDPPKLFAWPYGEYSAAQRDLIAGLGFEAAFGLASGVAYAQSDRFALPRFTLSDAFGSIERFRLSAEALPLVVADMSPADSLPLDNPPHVGFTVDPAMGELDQLACFAANVGRAQVEPLGGRRIELRLAEALPPGRARINCTLPGPDGRWRWLGVQLSMP
jgi:peptidoglycan/xylan/chitin deacetylase (PgdA/CDA1 family)